MPDKPGRTRFAADAMLGSLARKLRAFGYDTTYHRLGDDASLIALAGTQGRVILTSDRALATTAKSRGVRCLLVSGRVEWDRIGSLKKQAALLGVSLVSEEPLCSECNGELRRTLRSDLTGSVPTQVLARHRIFWRCRDCGRVYWKGSHWKKLRSLERRLKQD